MKIEILLILVGDVKNEGSDLIMFHCSLFVEACLKVQFETNFRSNRPLCNGQLLPCEQRTHSLISLVGQSEF